MLYIGVTLHYITYVYIFHRSNICPKTVEHEASHKHTLDKTYNIYKRTHEYVKEHQIIQKQLI
jgi:hypothetical protein